MLVLDFMRPVAPIHLHVQDYKSRASVRERNRYYDTTRSLYQRVDPQYVSALKLQNRLAQQTTSNNNKVAEFKEFINETQPILSQCMRDLDTSEQQVEFWSHLACDIACPSVVHHDTYGSKSISHNYLSFLYSSDT